MAQSTAFSTACIFVSPVYSHAMTGVLLPGKQGQTIHVDGADYLVGETTAKGLTFGMMDAAMQRTSLREVPNRAEQRKAKKKMMAEADEAVEASKRKKA